MVYKYLIMYCNYFYLLIIIVCAIKCSLKAWYLMRDLSNQMLLYELKVDDGQRFTVYSVIKYSNVYVRILATKLRMQSNQITQVNQMKYFKST